MYNLNCPKCGQIDRVDKVSSIYSRGVSSGTYSGPTTGVNMPVGKGQASVIGGYSTLSGSSQTLLSQRLAPPEKPSARGSLGVIVGIGAFVFVIGGLLGFLDLIYAINAPEEVEFHCCCGGTALGAIVMGICLVIYAGITVNKRAARVASQIPHWKRAMVRWNRLYYCARDDGVFDPEDGIFVPTEQMMDYIYR
jgi:hypothetical protein